MSAKAKSVVILGFIGLKTKEEKSAAIYNIVRNYSPVKTAAWYRANEIATLFIDEKLRTNALPDLNGLAWILFEAGRMEGIKEARRKIRRE